MKINPAIETAYKVLDGGVLTEAEALALLDGVHGCDVLDLVSLANKVRDKFAPKIVACSIINAKSGVCGVGFGCCLVVSLRIAPGFHASVVLGIFSGVIFESLLVHGHVGLLCCGSVRVIMGLGAGQVKRMAVLICVKPST